VKTDPDGKGGSIYTCVSATHVVTIKKQCRALTADEKKGGTETNCGETTVFCKRPVECVPSVYTGVGGAPTQCAEKALSEGAWNGNALHKVVQQCPKGG